MGGGSEEGMGRVGRPFGRRLDPVTPFVTNVSNKTRQRLSCLKARSMHRRDGPQEEAEMMERDVRARLSSPCLLLLSSFTSSSVEGDVRARLSLPYLLLLLPLLLLPSFLVSLPIHIPPRSLQWCVSLSGLPLSRCSTWTRLQRGNEMPNDAADVADVRMHIMR